MTGNLPGVLMVLSPIGSKAGKKGEMEKGRRGKEKIGRTGEKKISGENRAWGRFCATRLKPQRLEVRSRRIKASYRRPCLKNKEVGVALRSSVAGGSQTWFLNKNCRGMGSELDSQNLLDLMAEIYETLSEKPRAPAACPCVSVGRNVHIPC